MPMDGDKKYNVRMSTENVERSKRVLKIVELMIMSLESMKPDISDTLSGITTLFGFVMAKTDLTVEEMREMLKDLDDRIIESVLQQRNSLQ